jgi:hypothetical protein
MLRRPAREDQRSERPERGGWICLFGAEEGVVEEQGDAGGADEPVIAEPVIAKTAIAEAARRGIPRR